MSRARVSTRSDGRMKIGALEEAAGVTRDTIHFYIRSGLLHRPSKAGATVAFYDQTHLARLLRIRTLRAHGLPLPLIRRLLEDGSSAFGPDDLGLVARLFSCGERAEPPRAGALPPAAAELASELGVAAEVESDARLAAAVADVARLPGETGALARTLARAATAATRAALDAEARDVAAWLGLRDDPDAALAALPGALAAVRTYWSAARDALQRATLEAGVHSLLAAMERPRDGAAALPMLCADPTPRAAELTRELEARAARGDAGARADLARLLFAVASPRKLGEAARRARRAGAGAGGPWLALGAAVAALDAGDANGAREALARALAERPGWPLAEACHAVVRLFSAGRDEGAASHSGFLRETLGAVRALDCAPPPPREEPELDRLWTLLVRAHALRALPHPLDRAATARALLGEVLARTDALPADDPSRATGEVARLVGNAQLGIAALCATAGDRAGERAALLRAAAAGGAIAAAARGRLTLSRPAS